MTSVSMLRGCALLLLLILVLGPAAASRPAAGQSALLAGGSPGAHRATVMAFPSDIAFPLTTLPAQFNCSEASATFTVP